MRVLVACEESQEVCKAFRALGHEAYSCDIEPCSGGHPEWHLRCDALELLKIQLEPTDIVDSECGCHEAGTWFMKGGKDRQKNRAKTFPGLAKAMAQQWGGICDG